MSCNATKSRSGFLPDRTIHLHVTGRCNLACAHCYSSSSPYDSDMLDLGLLERTLGTLRTEGYEMISLSVGEPLLYPQLGALIDHAHALGYRVAAISNGYRVRPQHDALIARIDAIAISFDGDEDTHNRIRGRADAYRAAVGALEHLQRIGKPAAAAFTVSRESLPSIPEFVEMAVGLGVCAVQLRPLVMAGRARTECDSISLSSDDLFRLFLIGESLSEAYRDEILIHTDLAPAEAILGGRDAYADALAGDTAHVPLADLVNPLVVTPTGVLKPFTFDFPDAYDLGTLGDIDARGTGQIKAERFPPFRRLLDRVFADLAGHGDLIDWFAYCRDRAAEDGADDGASLAVASGEHIPSLRARAHLASDPSFA